VAARITRMAISPRLATKILFRPGDWSFSSTRNSLSQRSNTIKVAAIR
jgi:hypothetical protein